MSKMRQAKARPTIEQYGAFQGAYDYFNRVLWGGKLAPCMLVFTRRKSKAKGHFAHAAWSGERGPTHEISLTADILKSRDLRETFGTLVHEMCHLWQYDFGNPSRGGYHNGEWADEMTRVGLEPTDTGEPGGKRTGPKVTHYIVDDGQYEMAYKAMPDDVRLPWVTGGDDGREKAATPPSKVKYRCKCPKMNVWGKTYLTNLFCTECETAFEIDPKDLEKLKKFETGGEPEKVPEKIPEPIAADMTWKDFLDQLEDRCTIVHRKLGNCLVIEGDNPTSGGIRLRVLLDNGKKRVLSYKAETFRDVLAIRQEGGR